MNESRLDPTDTPHTLWTRVAREPLSSQQLTQLDGYLDGLIAWNQKLNLTRIVDRNDAAVRHIADALSLLRHIPATITTLADVGTGGGVPGVVLAIARPGLSVTLIDSTKKKLDAISAILLDIRIKNAAVLHARAELLRGKQRFEVVTSRAVAEMKTLVEWCWPLVKPGGIFLAMKGPKVVEEIKTVRFPIGTVCRVLAVEDAELSGHVIARVTGEMRSR